MTSLSTRRQWPAYGAVWRWHFYAGLLCVPFILWLACTGSIYLWRPQVEALLDQPYAHVADGLAPADPSRIAAAAMRAVPGSTLHHYQLPDTAGQAVQILVGKGQRETRVYVDPARLTILKVVDEDSRLMPTIFRLHGELMLGDRGSYIVELAASWTIFMILTGLVLWWPRGVGVAGVIYPRLRSGGRRFWRDLHAVTGFWVSAFALAFLITGLPWAAGWGAWLEAARNLAGPRSVAADWRFGSNAAIRARAQDDAGTRTALDLHAGHHMGSARQSSSPSTGDSLFPLNRMVPTVAALGLASPVLVSPPVGPGQAWTARTDTANRPQRIDLVLDAATGQALSARRFSDRPFIDQAVGYGVAAHEGQLFGLVNQLLNLAIALGLIVLAISGAIMWWRRKPEGALGAPPTGPSPPLATGFVALAVLFAIIFPIFGLSLVALIATERLLLRRLPRVRRWLGLRASVR